MKTHISKSREFKSLSIKERFLYYSLLYAADDYVVAKPREVMSDIEATDADMKTLIDKHFVLLLSGGEVGMLDDIRFIRYISSLKAPQYEPGEAKTTYFDAVQLTANELAELRKRYGDMIVKTQMQRLANFIKKDGNGGTDHYKTLVRWCENEKDKPTDDK